MQDGVPRNHWKPWRTRRPWPQKQWRRLSLRPRRLRPCRIRTYTSYTNMDRENTLWSSENDLQVVGFSMFFPQICVSFFEDFGKTLKQSSILRLGDQQLGSPNGANIYHLSGQVILVIKFTNPGINHVWDDSPNQAE